MEPVVIIIRESDSFVCAADTIEALQHEEPDFEIFWRGRPSEDGPEYVEAKRASVVTTQTPGAASEAEERRASVFRTPMQAPDLSSIGPSPFRQPAPPPTGRKGFGGHTD